VSDVGRRDLLLLALTFAAGAVDAVAFLALHVFTAVMTGNLVLLGVAIGQGAARNALRGVIAVGGYAIGVLGGARIVAAPSREALWSRAITRALVVEAALQAIFLGGWILTDATPDGIAAFALISISGIAMGLQAATTRAVALLSELSALGVRPDWWHRASIVIALVAGALAGAIALSTVPWMAPAIPLLVLAVVVLLVTATRDGAAG